MHQLKTRDLQPGDVMLKASDGSVLSKTISFGQNLVGQLNSQIVHAGVMFDNTYIIEAQGSGISANDLRVQNLNYNLIGAIGSIFGGPGNAKTAVDMDNLLDRILAGKGHPFFCSQFVVYVYQFVAEQNRVPAAQLFDLNDARVSPSVLARKLQGSASFKEVGYMMSNQR